MHEISRHQRLTGIRERRLNDDIPAADHFIQCHGQNIVLYLQKLCPFFQKHGSGRVAVAVIRKAVQRIEQAASETGIALVPEAHFFRNKVSRAKADPPDIIGQAIGVFPDDPDTFVSVSLVDLGRMACAHIVLL